MANPITIDIPHRLGAAEARRKLEGSVTQIAGIVPGGSLKSHRWEGNTLFFEIEALGQRVGTRLDVFNDHIHAVLDLPPMAALFADSIKAKLRGMGTKLLQ